MNIRGKVWKFGDNIDTDMMVPGEYLSITDHNQLAKICFASVRPEFPKQVKFNDILLVGKNFGCGSSREHAPLAIKAAGIRAIIGISFARIFFRNVFNMGLPLLEAPDAVASIADGTVIQIELSTGKISTEFEDFYAKPIPIFMRKLIKAGGLVEYLRK